MSLYSPCLWDALIADDPLCAFFTLARRTTLSDRRTNAETNCMVGKLRRFNYRSFRTIRVSPVFSDVFCSRVYCAGTMDVSCISSGSQTVSTLTFDRSIESWLWAEFIQIVLMQKTGNTYQNQKNLRFAGFVGIAWIATPNFLVAAIASVHRVETWSSLGKPNRMAHRAVSAQLAHGLEAVSKAASLMELTASQRVFSIGE